MNRSIVCALMMALVGGVGCDKGESPDRVPESVIQTNILGTASLSQQKWKEAEEAFVEALEQRPTEPLLLNNVAVALIQQSRPDEAEAYLDRALQADAEYPSAHYNLGLIEKNRGSFEAAAEHFEAVARHDSSDLVTQYNLGIVLSRINREDEAESAFRKALEMDPSHVSSLYGLGRFLIQSGRTEEGEQLVSRSQEIRALGGGTPVSPDYGEQGAYAMGVDFPADALAPPEEITVRFAAALETDTPFVDGALTRRLPDGQVVWVAAGPTGLQILAAGGLSDTATEAIPEGNQLLGATSGDVDDDGIIELIVLLTGPTGAVRPALMNQDAEGRFRWRETSSLDGLVVADGATAADVVLVDRDHDGDLDLFWCWTGSGAPSCALGTNDGAGQFAVNSSSEHGFTLSSSASGRPQLAFSDVDNDRDIDLLAGGTWGIQLFANQRDGSFEEISDRVGLDGQSAARSFALADLDKNGWMDLLLATPEGIRWLPNHNGRFDAPSAIDDVATTGLLVTDYDNDGFLDIARGSAAGELQLLRNVGSTRWDQVDVGLESGDPVASFDADGDGDLDLVARVASGSAVLLRNEGGNANQWIAADPVGDGDNRYAIGTKIEVLAGALRQKFEVFEPVPVHCGLGPRTTVESVRMLWPGGVLQDEIRLTAGERAELSQLDRKGTSCPLLYAWRDGRWQFVTDFLGGSAIGYQQRPGVFSVPDTDEYVLIENGLESADGWLRLRLNNQLEEVIWFDHAELLVVDHPAGSVVYPNERLMPTPPYPAHRLFVSSDVRPLVAARDPESGAELTATLLERDRHFVDNFERLPFKGYAESHALELDLGPFDERRQIVLLLDGWIDYADSSANVAAAQAGLSLQPPRLLLADGRGGWGEPEHLMGFPAGLPKTMAVELTGLFQSDDHRLRIETNMRIYWDRARVMVGGAELPTRVQRLRPDHAELSFGGFPVETSADGLKPFVYDPQRVSLDGGWKAHVGEYSAFGAVTEQLTALDDDFVTTRNGDQIELRFRAPEAPGDGWVRTYLLFADGFGKDMDPNSAASERVGPIPFHDMRAYPYGTDVVPPRTATARPGRVVSEHPRGWPGALPQPLAARDAR